MTEYITINGEQWSVVFPLGIHRINPLRSNEGSYYGMLIGRILPGREFGVQFKTLNVSGCINTLLLTGL